jgi:hypothetical protein
MYNGESTYFAFKYTSTDAAASTWEIDNALLSGAAAVGIAEIEETNVQIYPNPATDFLNISCEKDGQLRIINLAGQSILEIETRKGTNQLNVQHLKQGLYILQFINKVGAVSTKKLLIR